jgi:hypothetical protein
MTSCGTFPIASIIYAKLLCIAEIWPLKAQIQDLQVLKAHLKVGMPKIFVKISRRLRDTWKVMRLLIYLQYKSAYILKFQAKGELDCKSVIQLPLCVTDIVKVFAKAKG